MEVCREQSKNGLKNKVSHSFAIPLMNDDNTLCDDIVLILYNHLSLADSYAFAQTCKQAYDLFGELKHVRPHSASLL